MVDEDGEEEEWGKEVDLVHITCVVGLSMEN